MPNASWRTPTIPAVQAQGDMMIVRFGDKERLQPDDGSRILEGFSVAGEDGKFYMAYARYVPWDKKDTWTKGWQTVRVWSPMVKNPVALRYAWSTSPMGNLKYQGDQDIPLASFRTDDWDLPESDDPTEKLFDGTFTKERKADAQERLEYRRAQEAKRAAEILKRLKLLTESLGELEQTSGD
jgi:sialate O-acetylesterase